MNKYLVEACPHQSSVFKISLIIRKAVKSGLSNKGPYWKFEENMLCDSETKIHI